MIFTQKELDREEWRDILGYDYQYQISDLGRIKRVTSLHNKSDGKISTGSLDKNGYLRTGMTKNGKCVTKKVHRLVAEYFIEGYSEDLTINHIDFSKSNNRLTNLEVMSASENILDYINKIRKVSSSSKCFGVNYHKQTGKWVARITVDKIRLPLGSYLTEEEACQAVINYKEGNLIPITGKGQKLKGRQKFTEIEIEYAIRLSYEIGVPKASEITKISTTTLSTLRKKWKSK